MKGFFKTALAVFFAMTAAACVENVEPGSTDVENGDDGKIQVTVGGRIEGYASQEGTKATAENAIRIMWQGGETVYVYGGKDYLGTLAASVDETDGTYATLSGTIDKPAEGRTITLVYSPDFSARPDPGLDGVITLDLSTQSGQDVPFLIYGITDSLEGAESRTVVSGQVVTFKPATSVYKFNCSDIPEGPVSKATIENINTKCVITLSDETRPAVSGTGRGTISRTGGFTAADRRVIFSAALAPDNDKARFNFNVNKNGQDYDATFYGMILAAKAYSDVFVLKPYGALPGKFTVSPSGKQVYFTRHNMWHDSRDSFSNPYHIDDDGGYSYVTPIGDGKIKQIDTSYNRQYYSLPRPYKDSTWYKDHVFHFFWNEREPNIGWQQYSYDKDFPPAVTDVFTTNQPGNDTVSNTKYPFRVVGGGRDMTGLWRLLSASEWRYLLEEREMTYGKPRYSNWYGGIRIGDNNDGVDFYIQYGLFIYPDDYNSDEITMNPDAPYKVFNWDEIDAAGILFLPRVGTRDKDQVKWEYADAKYWTATADEEDPDQAYCVRFDGGKVSVEPSSRAIALPIRLVRECE